MYNQILSASVKQSGQEDVVLTIETENQGTLAFQIKKAALARQMSEHNVINIQEVYEVPTRCASIQVVKLFQRYCHSKNMNIYRQRKMETETLIGTLRLADFIGLNLFQQNFISDIVIPTINITNCISFLEQTHKKLKNQQNGSQCWYSLLNACITYIAQHLSQIYNRSEDKIKGLHEKILNEILDRAIRNGNNDEQKIFELIMKSRKASSVHGLCQILRKSIMNKKINSKIHAKLSWKLQDVLNINEKKTKIFKFLQYEWMLLASRNNKNDLTVSLVFCGMTKKQIGSFYIKLMWWLDGKLDTKKDEEMKINYLVMNQKHDLKVLNLTETMQRELGKSKIELSIFCCMDQIYTFTLNYIAKNCQRINLEERQLAVQELEVLARLFKEKQEYVSSIRYIKYLSTITNNLPMDLICSYPTRELGTHQNDFIQKIKSQRNVSNSEISSRIHPNSDIFQSNSVSTFSRKSQERPERPQSKGRLRKIFATSPSRSVGSSGGGGLKMQDINRITNIKNYFYDKNHPLYYQV